MSTRALLAWLDRPSDERGIRFARSGELWDFWSYQRLAELTRRVADGLVAAGVGRGDVVGVIQPSGPGFVATLFGAMLAGAAPSPVAPPALFGNTDAYREHLTGVFAAARPVAVVVDDTVAADLASLAPNLGRPMWTIQRLVAVGGPADRDTGGDHPSPELSDNDLALAQFTSGSTGTCRGVRVTYAALEANVAAIRRWLGMTGEHATASWLPVHHDMGLIGCLITPAVDGGDIWLLSPEDFVRNPLRYLQCFGAYGARYTAMPTFGLEYIVRRVRPSDLAGLDFADWQTIIVGAERIDPEVLDQFCERLGPFGLAHTALSPAYGLAEATLAVTGLPVDEGWAVANVVPETLSPGDQVRLATDPRDGRPTRIVGCGRPLPGVTIKVVDPDGRVLPEGHVGEIVVGGASLADGYLSTAAGAVRLDRAPESLPHTTFADAADAALRTGDAGWLADGQLYVLGRIGDGMKVRGRMVYAEDVEGLLVLAGIPLRQIAVLLGDRAGVPTAVAVIERAEQDWLARAEHELRLRLGAAAIVVVLDVPRGTIARTSSGKPRRRPLWHRFLRGELPGTVSPTSARDLPT